MRNIPTEYEFLRDYKIYEKRNNSYFSYFRLPFAVRRERGFTLIEMLVVIVIMGSLLAVVVANFRQNEKRVSINESAELIVSSLRQMQNNTLSGLSLPNGNPANKYSIEFLTSSPTQYTMYVYSDDVTRTPIETGRLVDGVSISALQTGGIDRTLVEIQFRPPFGEVFTRMSGVVQIQPDIITSITVTNNSGYTKSIITDGTSGRIYTQ